MKLSLVVPCYNEAESVALFQEAVIQAFDGYGYDYEIIFIDDGSKDATLHNLKKLHAAQRCPVKVVSFSRNFGKEAAISAGLASAKGDCVVVLDCDLQHPPKTIVEMYRKWEQGFEIVEGVKNYRGNETAIRRGFAKFFYKIISALTGFDMENASDFKLLSKQVVSVLDAGDGKTL